MSDRDLVILSSADWELALAPAQGGSIAWLERREEGISVLRGSRGWPPTVLEAASFPLVPFSNRIRNGSFRFRGREVTLTPNMPPDPSPLHGQGWLSAWEVASRSQREADVFRHPAGEWPWAYEARQRFRLDEQAFEVELSCTNRSDEPMPCGLGQHPYFPCTDETRIDTAVGCAWTIDGMTLPVARVAAEGRYDLRHRRICGQELDNGFGGWNGRALLETPGVPFLIEISSPDADYFQLYSPEAGGFIVAEPVSHANAALNEPEEDWAALGLRVLGPGETMKLLMRIALLPATAEGDEE